ncbi:hypothetical protein [Acinetobacter brisouii]|uniref:hypothetical protein n=1 Tax=Acinetobacter brisouii TaxID=396323 RepID=UPI00124EF845|nr:hypothetical protein [Acinetobacter brisouii]
MTKTNIAIVTECRDGASIPIALLANALVLQGTFAVINADGYAIASTDVGGANQTCLGIWDHSAENTGADGEIIATANCNKQFLVRNSNTDPVNQTDLGNQVYIEDNQTVAKTDGTGTRSLAGRFMGFDTQYNDCVWVEI